MGTFRAVVVFELGVTDELLYRVRHVIHITAYTNGYGRLPSVKSTHDHEDRDIHVYVDGRVPT